MDLEAAYLEHSDSLMTFEETPKWTDAKTSPGERRVSR